MAKTVQNQVPPSFSALYSPLLELKLKLQSAHDALPMADTIQGFMMLHYSCFIMCHLYKLQNLSIDNFLALRSLIEEITKDHSFELTKEYSSKIYSFIDRLGKELNTTSTPYAYIALYHAYLNSEIYRHLHPELEIYEFVENGYINRDSYSGLKQFHDASLLALEENKLPIKKSGVKNKTKSK